MRDKEANKKHNQDVLTSTGGNQRAQTDLSIEHVSQVDETNRKTASTAQYTASCNCCSSVISDDLPEICFQVSSKFSVEYVTTHLADVSPNLSTHQETSNHHQLEDETMRFINFHLSEHLDAGLISRVGLG